MVFKTAFWISLLIKSIHTSSDHLLCGLDFRRKRRSSSTYLDHDRDDDDTHRSAISDRASHRADCSPNRLTNVATIRRNLMNCPWNNEVIDDWSVSQHC